MYCRRLRDLTREQGQTLKVSAQVSSGILSDMHACFIACETGRDFKRDRRRLVGAATAVA